MKIVIINHSFQKSFFRNRWEQFAKSHKDVDIYLITPKEFKWGESKALTFGVTEKIVASNIENNNFHVITIKSKKTIIPGWKSTEFKRVLKTIKPDFIYHIGTHTQNPIFQLINLKKRMFKKTILISFSMRGTNTTLKSRIELIKYEKNLIKKILRFPLYILDCFRLKKFNKYVDCVVCHYPDAKDLFVKEGFQKKISVQTQVGVDTSVFAPNDTFRNDIRKKYSISDGTFVFGSASRFHYSKGILQILDALNFDGDWKYLLIGSGTDEEVQTINKKIIENHLSDRVIMTGYVPVEEMPMYWNALDCAIHFPISTPKWIETFSLALVQAMATKLPVIGSSSGSVPYQVGEKGLIIEEGNSSKLSLMMQKIMRDKEFSSTNANNMFARARQFFSVTSLNEQFYNLLLVLIDQK